MSEIDIAILAKIKQGFLYKYMQVNNINQAELARRIGLNAATMGKIINFKWIPTKEGNGHGRYQTREIIKKLEKYFGFSIEVLFPPELTAEVADKLSKKHVAFKTIETCQIEQVNPKYLSYYPDEEKDHAAEVEMTHELLACLTPQQEQVIIKRFGIGCEAKTLRAIADDMRFVSSERIRQIEAKALKKMKKVADKKA